MTDDVIRLHQTKWSLAGYLLVVVIVVNVFTYWFLCRPELEMKEKDPAGYSYLQAIVGRAGWIWALAPRQRCAVHCIFATVLILVIFVVIGIFSKYQRASRARSL